MEAGDQMVLVSQKVLVSQMELVDQMVLVGQKALASQKALVSLREREGRKGQELGGLTELEREQEVRAQNHSLANLTPQVLALEGLVTLKRPVLG